MPFTIVHPAAVLPLRRWLGHACVLDALVIGSMAPDFVYFVPGRPMAETSHSLWGACVVVIPLALIAWIAFRWLLRPAILELLPDMFRARLLPQHGVRFSGWWLFTSVLLSTVIGVCTHIAWDAFTHAGAPGVRYFPVLTTPLFNIADYTVYVYKALQHGSTALGFAVISFYASRWYRSTSPRIDVPRRMMPQALRSSTIAVLSALLIAGAMTSALSHGGGFTGIRWLQSVAMYAITGGIGMAVAGMAIYAIAFRACHGLQDKIAKQ